MRRGVMVAFAAGLLPVMAANLAFLVNVATGMEACVPYWEGCMSVSRGIRSGPGLLWFKALALPSAVAMAWCWHQAGHWLQQAGCTRRRRWVVWTGAAGAAFFLVYAAWLGTDGEVYRWLRRYGVVFYFGLTGLAQLLFLASVRSLPAGPRSGQLRPAVRTFGATVALMWGLGIASAFKRKLIEDPAFLDRVENALEWNFALVLSLAFVALGFVLHRLPQRNAT